MKAKKSAKKSKKTAKAVKVDATKFNWDGLTCRIGKLANTKPPKEIKKVTPQVLESIADMIYDPKSKRFLNLCAGTLQNGDDPANPKRPMHCGLGEVYYAIKGRQPEDDGVSEDDVCELVCERSGLKSEDDLRQEATEEVLKKIRSLKLDEDLTASLLEVVHDAMGDREFSSAREDLFSALNDIPNKNDANNDEEGPKAFAERSRRVADRLREAAQILRDANK